MMTTRRDILVGAAALAAAMGARAAPLTALGVFSLLGEFLDVTIADAPNTDTRIDRTERRTLDVPAIGFDNIVLLAAREALAAQRPAAKAFLYRAPVALPAPDQRTIAGSARKAELPSWMVQAIQRDKLSHLLIVTRQRAEAAFPVNEGHTLGRGKLDGIGYHIDPYFSVQVQGKTDSSNGILGAFVLLDMVLLDANSGEVVHEQAVHDQGLVEPRGIMAANDPWMILTPTQRAELLRQMVERNARRGIDRALRAV